MIDKIKDFIEDNTSMEITNNQVVMMLVIVGALFLLIIMIMFGSGGPKETPNYVSKPPVNDPVHAQ